MDWYSGLPQIMPLGVLEVSGVPTNTQVADYFDSGCRADLLTINNSPIDVRISGTFSDALTLETCEGSLLSLKVGEQTLRAVPGLSLIHI